MMANDGPSSAKSRRRLASRTNATVAVGRSVKAKDTFGTFPLSTVSQKVKRCAVTVHTTWRRLAQLMESAGGCLATFDTYSMSALLKVTKKAKPIGCQCTTACKL